jgi:hypothetical protein
VSHYGSRGIFTIQAKMLTSIFEHGRIRHSRLAQALATLPSKESNQ